MYLTSFSGRSSILASCRPVCALSKQLSRKGQQRMASDAGLGPQTRSVEESVQRLTDNMNGGSWTLSKDGLSMERALKFKTFKAAWAFMDAVAQECKKHRHHPEWSNLYNQVFVRWTTHSTNGLTEKDITMATICDDISQREESKAIVEAADYNTSLRQLTDDFSSKAGDCCKR